MICCIFFFLAFIVVAIFFTNVMGPKICAVNGCSTQYKKGQNIFIKSLKSLKFIKKGTEEYNHRDLLLKFILSYRDSTSKDDTINSQIHRGQCGICERHFKDTDFVICK